MIEHIHLKDCHSTQDILKEQLSQGNFASHILVSCDNQVAGRGRGERIWEAMPGTLCLSLSLAPHPELSFTALELSVLVARFFEARGKELRLKWPNDLWTAAGKKCGGILVQATGDAMLAGIGLNLFSNSEEYGGIYEEAFELDKKAMARELADFILRHRYGSKEGLVADWEGRCFHLNQRVQIKEGTEVFEGKFLGLGTHGEAIVSDRLQESHVYNGSLYLAP